MNIKKLIGKISSVSAAAAALVGSTDAHGHQGGPLPSIRPDSGRKDGDPIEPLLLKPSPIPELSEAQFAGHRSHSSHRSHYSSNSGHSSHYSGTSYVAPSRTYVTPSPTFQSSTPRPAAQPAYPYVAPSSVNPVRSATPFPAPRATPIPTPGSSVATTRIEFTNGAILYGTVLVKSAAGISFRSLDGKTYKLPRVLLTANTISALNLPSEEGAGTAPAP